MSVVFFHCHELSVVICWEFTLTVVEDCSSTYALARLSVSLLACMMREYFHLFLGPQTIATGTVHSDSSWIISCCCFDRTANQFWFLSFLLFQHLLMFLQEIFEVYANSHHSSCHRIETCLDCFLVTSGRSSWHFHWSWLDLFWFELYLSEAVLDGDVNVWDLVILWGK